jgi:YfiH family protein
MSTETTTSSARPVTEILQEGTGALTHPEWSSDLPWLVQGTTTRGGGHGEGDLGLFSGGASEAVARRNWERLLTSTGMSGAAHARQLHGAVVRWHGSVTTGVHLSAACDGHATSRPGLLLAVSVADCVPVFLVAPRVRAVAALHAGWRGAAAGVLEGGIELLTRRTSVEPEALRVHLGPAICGRCYEVGPEVFEALGLPAPARQRPVDLRAVLAQRAIAVGVTPSRVSVSTHCTRCTGSALFSHRGGDRGRQVGYIGVHP